MNDTKERSRISYHGAMITLCYFLHNDYILKQLGIKHPIYKTIHNLAIYNDSAKSKFLAKVCVSYLSTHKQLK